jgi:hypothetical protein
MAQNIYDIIKDGLTLGGIKFTIGTGFNLSLMKPSPYLKVSLLDIGKSLDFGLIADSLQEIGVAAGLKITRGKAKIILDAGIVTPAADLFAKAKKDFSLFGGFRIGF